MNGKYNLEYWAPNTPVYFVNEDEKTVTRGIVVHVELNIFDDWDKIYYYLKTDDGPAVVDENKVFETKAEAEECLKTYIEQ